MEPVEYGSFSGRDLQNIQSLLVKAEQAGVREIGYLRQSIEDWKHRGRQNGRRKNAPTRGKEKPAPRITNDKTERFGVPCPDCHKGYLTIKVREGVTYTACPQCFKTVEFK